MKKINMLDAVVEKRRREYLRRVRGPVVYRGGARGDELRRLTSRIQNKL